MVKGLVMTIDSKGIERPKQGVGLPTTYVLQLLLLDGKPLTATI